MTTPSGLRPVQTPSAPPKAPNRPVTAPLRPVPSTQVLCDVSISVGSKSNVAGRFRNIGVNQSLANVIDCLGPFDGEVHSQTSHVWWSPSPLELLFNFSNSYDISQLLFWNFNQEGYDVDTILLEFFGAQDQLVGRHNFVPRVGTTVAGSIVAETVTFPATFRGVSRVSAILNAANGQLDFQNLLFAV